MVRNGGESPSEETFGRCETLAHVARNHGGFDDRAPAKQARQSHYPDRERRAAYATALEQQQAAEKAEREKAGM